MNEIITIEGILLDALPGIIFSAAYVLATLALKSKEWLPGIIEDVRSWRKIK
jgi:hypothetical protein